MVTQYDYQTSLGVIFFGSGFFAATFLTCVFFTTAVSFGTILLAIDVRMLLISAVAAFFASAIMMLPALVLALIVSYPVLCSRFIDFSTALPISEASLAILVSIDRMVFSRVLGATFHVDGHMGDTPIVGFIAKGPVGTGSTVKGRISGF